MDQEQTQQSMETPRPRGQEVAAEVAPKVAPEKPPYYNEAIRGAPTVEEAASVARNEGKDIVIHADETALAQSNAIHITKPTPPPVEGQNAMG